MKQIMEMVFCGKARMKKSLVFVAATVSILVAVTGFSPVETSIKARPPVSKRKFRSEAVERKLVETKAKISDPKLAEMFEKCFANPLDMAVTHIRDENGDDDTWIIAGDLPDMWLRDSTTQALPYLPYMCEDDGIRRMIGGLLRRQFKCVVIDPYANSFTLDPTKPSRWMSDMTDMKRELHERKYELDSLCYVLRLAGEYWRLTGDKAVFDRTWLQAMEKILDVMKTQQRKAGLKTEYHFQRKSANPVDSLPNAGYGHPAKPCGLIASAFRPSDDATVFPFLVPSNFMAVDSLRRAATVLEEANGELEMARTCRDLADEVSAALLKHAVVRHPKYGEVYAYEVDGYGGVLLGDDANAPSLLSLPYLAGVPKNDPIYLNTRRLVWSKDNPYFFTNGEYGGIGSPHTGIDMFWPLSCIIRALTTDNRSEIADSLEIIKKVDFGTGFIHEGVDMSDPGKYTRHWFGWANALFGELMVKLVDSGYFNPGWRGFNRGDLAIQGEFEGVGPEAGGCERRVSPVDGDSTAAVQIAIDDAFRAGGGTVRLSKGVYDVKALRLRSRVTLYLESGSVIKGSRNPEDYFILDGDAVEPVDPALLDHGAWTYQMSDLSDNIFQHPGHRWNNGLIRLFRAEDAAIVGEPGSLIDGSNVYDPKGEELYRGPHAISAIQCKRLTFRGYTIKDSANWGHRVMQTQGLTVEDVTVLAGHDGVHFDSCDDVLIRRCTFKTGDDCVAGFDNWRVTVENCSLNTACSGMRLAGCDVVVSNCTLKAPGEYGFRGGLSPEDKAASAPSGRSSRNNTLCFFTCYGDFTHPIRKSSENIRFVDCTIDGADRLMHCNFWNERWQRGRPLVSVSFERVRAAGLKMPVCAWGDCFQPLSMLFKDCEFSFEGVQPEFIRGANIDIVSFEGVKVKGVDGPALRTWTPETIWFPSRANGKRPVRFGSKRIEGVPCEERKAEGKWDVRGI